MRAVDANESRRAGENPDGWQWSERHGDVRVRFIGKRGKTGRAIEDGTLLPDLPEHVSLANLEQVHSATVVDARPGKCGPGDALITASARLALCVVTADCVPILLSDGTAIAAVHAGWRGLEKRILPATIDRMEAGSVTAWIGPAIGACCYEVGREVAARVAASCHGQVLRAGGGERPHLDLLAVAESQLRELGVSDIRKLARCTSCEPRAFWSYRRDGAGCGRNLSVIWRHTRD